MTPTLARATRRTLLAGALALTAGVAGPAALAGAQATPTLTVDPATIAVGESTTITATGCVADGVDQSLLFVLLTIDHAGQTDSQPQSTDAEGTMVLSSGEAPPGAEGTYSIAASCVIIDGGSPETVFDYDGPVVLTVVAGEPTNPTITVAPTTSTTRPAAAAAATVTPAFTG